MDAHHLASLNAFRSALYGAFGRRHDALFDLCDTQLATGPVTSLPHLSLQAPHRRQWGSLYDALVAGEVSAAALEALLAAHPLVGGEPIYAVDASVWMRCDAETSPERAIYYHPSTARRVITLGSRSSPAGPITGLPSSAWHGTVGPPR